MWVDLDLEYGKKKWEQLKDKPRLSGRQRTEEEIVPSFGFEEGLRKFRGGQSVPIEDDWGGVDYLEGSKKIGAKCSPTPGHMILSRKYQEADIHVLGAPRKSKGVVIGWITTVEIDALLKDEQLAFNEDGELWIHNSFLTNPKTKMW